MTTGGKGIAYTALKNINCAERPKPWSIQDMDKEKTVETLLEDVADYFSEISNKNPTVTEDDVPQTYDRPLYEITPDMVISRVKETKKPKSTVPGDIPPNLIMQVIRTLAGPLSWIYNDVPRFEVWPSSWRKEYQTIIPKKSNPESFADVRNLLCTNFFSKILESFVIDSLKHEVEFSELQYGGLKGTGADNFLCEVYNVLETLENPGSAVCLMSLDFSKAFNRLSHSACLRKLSEKYASNQSLGLVYSFLQGRKMQVRSGHLLSRVRDVTGGSPQGTKLGNLLFCLAIDDIAHEVGRGEFMDNNGSPENAIPNEYQPTLCSTPIRNLEDSFEPNPYGMRVKKNVVRDSILLDGVTEEEVGDAWTYEIGYVDDINVGEEITIDTAIRHITTEQEKKTIRAKGCEKMYLVIKENGEDLGLRLNPSKTQLICFHANQANVRAYVVIDGKILESTNELKILGFRMDKTGSVGPHVRNMCKKNYKSVWSLRHLKKAKLKRSSLVRVYCSMMRPILEYACNVFGPMITNELAKKVENCQKKVLKIIFGYDHDYEKLLELSGIKRLDQRRKDLFRKFSMKMSASTRFSRKWLPKKECRENIRETKRYIEFHARTTRLYRSPIFTMRRLLNSSCIE